MKIKRFSLLDKLAGRKVLYHGTSDEGASGIKERGLQKSFYKDVSNNTLKKLEKHKKGTLNPMLEKLMDFDKEKYKDLVYMTSDKNSADFMANVNKKKGRGGQTLEISLPYSVHRKMTPISNPEYQQAAHIHDVDGMSRYLLDKPYRELGPDEKKNIDSFVKAKKGDWIVKEDIPSKYVKGSKDYQGVTLKEIINHLRGKDKK